MKQAIFMVILMAFALINNAQESVKKSKKEIKAEKKAQQIEKTKALIDSKTFVFNARSANPMKGRMINLTSSYDIKVKNDSVFSYMPYFGVAYSASYGSNEGPMTFEQPIESYNMEPEKSGYFIKIKVKNKIDTIDLAFHVSENGSATLTALSTNRQSITYYGDIVEAETKK